MSWIRLESIVLLLLPQSHMVNTGFSQEPKFYLRVLPDSLAQRENIRILGNPDGVPRTFPVLNKTYLTSSSRCSIRGDLAVGKSSFISTPQKDHFILESSPFPQQLSDLCGNSHKLNNLDKYLGTL